MDNVRRNCVIESENVKISRLKKFIESVDNLEEMPHSFDDTLISRLVSSLSETDSFVVSFLTDIGQLDNNHERSSVQLDIILRLIERFSSTLFPSVFDKFYSSCCLLLGQDRPSFVICSVLRVLYVNRHHIKDFSVILQFSRKILPDESVSVFIRSQLENLLVDSDEVRNMTTFLSNLLRYTNSFVVRNSAARLLRSCLIHLVPQEKIAILENIRCHSNLGNCVFELAADLCPLEDAMEYLKEEYWIRETDRKEIAFKLALRHKDKSVCETLQYSVLHSPSATLYNFTEILADADISMIRRVIPMLCGRLSLKKFAPRKELVRFIEVMSKKMLPDEISPLLIGCEDRLLESTSIFEALQSAYGREFLDNCNFLDLKNKLHNYIADLETVAWDIKDNILEIGTMCPSIGEMLCEIALRFVKSEESPYVRASALRLLITVRKNDNLSKLCEEVFTNEWEPQPLIEAAMYLASRYPASCDGCMKVFRKCFDHSDLGVRLAAIKIAINLLQGEFSAIVEKELVSWREDPEIGPVVCSVIGFGKILEQETSEHILDDMLAALEIHANEDADCY